MSNSLVRKILSLLAYRGETLATAESCTGGGIVKCLTDIAGSSACIWGGIVAYTNAAKTSILGVSPVLLEREGAVSSGVAKSMVWGVKSLSGVDWSVSVTGIAGPQGGMPNTPVGTVWIAWCDLHNCIESQIFSFKGDRDAVRAFTVIEALQGLEIRLDKATN